MNCERNSHRRNAQSSMKDDDVCHSNELDLTSARKGNNGILPGAHDATLTSQPSTEPRGRARRSYWRALKPRPPQAGALVLSRL